MSEYTIYHNPKCSKSRSTLELLRARGIEPTIIEYLKTPPTAAELTALVKKLGIQPQELVRKGEDLYQQKYAGKLLTAVQWIEVMAQNPILIERPIVVAGARAVLGRPPENVEQLL